MPPPATPAKLVLLRTTETLSIAAAGGVVLAWLGFPAGLVTGSLLAVAVAALAGRPVTVPAALSRAISVLVGISLGAVVTPATIKGLAAFPLSLAVLVVSTLCMLAATASYLCVVHGWDRQSALLGASPGGLAQVMVLAAEFKADLRAIAIVQTVRVVALTLGIPAGLALFGLAASGGVMMARLGAGLYRRSSHDPVVVSTARRWRSGGLRLPGGLLFGSMLGSGVLHGFGWIDSTLPWWVACGRDRDRRHDRLALRRHPSAHAAALSRRRARLVRGGAFGRLGVRAAVDHADVGAVADAVVAFAPGAQDTMMVLALALHLDPVFVGALHLSRFLLVSLLVPFLAHRLQAGARAKPHAQPPGAAPIGEDNLLKQMDYSAASGRCLSGRPSSCQTSTSASASASINASS